MQYLGGLPFVDYSGNPQMAHLDPFPCAATVALLALLVSLLLVLASVLLFASPWPLVFHIVQVLPVMNRHDLPCSSSHHVTSRSRDLYPSLDHVTYHVIT
jgi:hypothetical protein